MVLSIGENGFANQFWFSNELLDFLGERADFIQNSLNYGIRSFYVILFILF